LSVKSHNIIPKKTKRTNWLQKSKPVADLGEGPECPAPFPPYFWGKKEKIAGRKAGRASNTNWGPTALSSGSATGNSLYERDCQFHKVKAQTQSEKPGTLLKMPLVF